MTSSFDRLAQCLARLPGVGRRSAERMALRLLGDRDGLLRELAAALEDARTHASFCSRCGSLTASGQDPCRLCTSASRDGALVCVVEEPNDIVMIERSGGFNGRYHALMGKISPMRGEGPGNLRIGALLDRVEKENIREVVLALSTDVEGDATSSYIASLLKPRGVKVSRLAYGLPAGSGIAYSDPLTLARAMRGRVEAEPGE